MNQTNETTNTITTPNSCLKCGKEIDPELYYCDKCSDKRMKLQFVGTIFASAIILLVASVISANISLGGLFTALLYIVAFALIGFIWKKFIYADSDLRDVPESEDDEQKIIQTNYTVGIDLSAGTHHFKSINQQIPATLIIRFPNGKEKNMCFDGIKKIKLKQGTSIELKNCKIVN